MRETEEIQVIIQTEDVQLRRLPLHLWDLFYNHYTKAEIALSAPEYKPQDNTAPVSNKVRILAILGDSTGIDVEKDKALLDQLPNAETTFLVDPQRRELTNLLWEKQWEILFFAGHSSSQVDGNTGKIYINKTDSLSIAELKNTLRTAIEHGLQLAIFNSCDGLGLARELADLHIPQIIIMREPVPDRVAQEFLKHFLSSFSQGKSLYSSVREARERLEGLENQFPFASWLPVIYQNPAVVPLTWQGLWRGTASDRNRMLQKLSITIILFIVGLILSSELVRHVAEGLVQKITNNSSLSFKKEHPKIPQNHWKAEYFNTPTPKGKSVSEPQDLGDCKQLLNPKLDELPPNIPSDNFSARITTTCYFPPGMHLIKVLADDGIRVKVGNQEIDEQIVIDQLTDDKGCKAPEIFERANYFLSEGKEYTVTVEYCEKSGYAGLQLEIQQHKFFAEPVNLSNEWHTTFYRWYKNTVWEDKPLENFDKKDADKIAVLNLGANQRLSDGKRGIEKEWKAFPKDNKRLSTDFFVASGYTKAYFEEGKKYRAVVNSVDDGFQLLLREAQTNNWIYITTPQKQWQPNEPKVFPFEVTRTGTYDFYFFAYEVEGIAAINFFWEEITSSMANYQLKSACLKSDNTINNWKGEYFSNGNLIGSPLYIEDLNESSQKLFCDWGHGAPPNIPSNNFSARITTTRYFAPGNYLIKAKADDGIRVWVNEQLLIDRAKDAYIDFQCNYFHSKGGKYPVKVEYREDMVLAYLSVDIQPKESASASDCKFEEPVSGSK